MISDVKSYKPVVLVVDDEPSICLLAGEVLREVDLYVLTAGDGYEALRLLAAENRPVDLALLDYSLPGMDCETLIAELQRINRNIKVVISSGAPDLVFSNPESASIHAMMPKPYSMRQLADLVLSLVRPAPRSNERTD